MKKIQHFYVVIKPYRKDFLINPKEEEDKLMKDHFQYLKLLLKQKKLFLAGPTLIPEDPSGIIIFETETADEAKRLLEEDPSIKVGIQKITEFRPIRLSLTKE